MRNLFLSPLALILVIGTVVPSYALPSCGEGRRKVEEANALRFQARQEARIGDQGRVCDTLDEVGDRYAEAKDAFEDCGADVVAIDLRSETRALRVAKSLNRCN